jgi:hypothetical protein
MWNPSQKGELLLFCSDVVPRTHPQSLYLGTWTSHTQYHPNAQSNRCTRSHIR